MYRKGKQPALPEAYVLIPSLPLSSSTTSSSSSHSYQATSSSISTNIINTFLPACSDEDNDVFFNMNYSPPSNIPSTNSDPPDPARQPQEFETYIPMDTPWVVAISTKLKTYHPGATVVGILGPQHFEELRMISCEAFEAILFPSEHAGSIARFVIKLTHNDNNIYYLIKETNPSYGPNEIVIGDALRKLNLTSNFIPALFGVLAVAQQGVGQSYYVVVPWLKNSLNLHSFLKNNQVERHKLPTKMIFEAVFHLLNEVDQAWKVARFAHLDSKSNQVLVTFPFKLYFIDFGHSSIDVNINGEHYKVLPQKVSTRSFRQDMEYLISSSIDRLIEANSVEKDVALVKAWKKVSKQFRDEKISLQAVCNWLRDPKVIAQSEKGK